MLLGWDTNKMLKCRSAKGSMSNDQPYHKSAAAFPYLNLFEIGSLSTFPSTFLFSPFWSDIRDLSD